jgi:hypothetical protein
VRRRLIILGFVALIFFGLALPAVAPYIQGPTGDPKQYQWNPSGVVSCPVPKTYHFIVYTYGFGPLDSTGDTTLRVFSPTGVASRQYLNVEHDGTTRYWDSGKNSLDRATITFDNLSSVGRTSSQILCDY